ncbi:HAMP domain-containing histidine kinase [Sulfurovum sp. bin170]|uniref:sensor histidine kinase n=1 Tax=Sulfurovum sp. bin170 TaxID=2695268 RepID=UPI0013E0E2C5|nr:HAMP domain-containing sensor histidine kinase [Sulfurovum sp. bin170]NEW61277.1 HAMP domain-containing histidine kinase [Sulfurovum sp. bin170]
MLRSEKRSLFRFLGIYLSSTFILFFLATVIFYDFQKHQIIDTQNAELSDEAERLTQALRQLNKTFTPSLIYPQEKPFDSAIYSLDRAYIFGSFNPKNLLWDKEYYQQGEQLFHIHPLYPYYLGVSHLVIARTINQEPIDNLIKMSILFLFVAGILFTLLGVFLGKLFIAPMKESIEKMNRFIEDTTHEFNTPISTILTNIELLDALYDCEGKQEMKRIEIASKTLSRLYEDLTYLKLNHNYHRQIETLNIAQLTRERIEYFYTLIEAKQLNLNLHIEKNILLDMDKNDAIRMIDNLLSNAIKYNKKKGLLMVTLTQEKLSITDSGVGIIEKNIELIRGRFKRDNKSEGGFGIGLDIVGQVVERYSFEFDIISTYNKSTKVVITW